MELPAEVPTLDGHTIKIDKTTDGDVLVAGNKVVMPDIEASNGVIHGIENVITETTPEPEAGIEEPQDQCDDDEPEPRTDTEQRHATTTNDEVTSTALLSTLYAAVLVM